MKLIDAPIGIFRFDGELVLKTEYKSENKLSGKYIPDCYIVRTGEYFWGGAKTANELNNLDVEPVDFAELLPTVTDTISRQQAIDICRAPHMRNADCSDFEMAIMMLPPAQPAPDQNGDLWITVPDIDKVTRIYVQESKGKFCRIFYEEQEQPEPYVGHWTVKEGELAFWDVCSVCRKMIIHRAPHYNFCPNCGADMREVTT